MAAGIPADIRAKIPNDHVGTPDEVAQIAVLLAQNPRITAQTININAGRYMT